MNDRFGADYASSVAADYRLSSLGGTVNEALASGVDAKDVWRALCAEFDMPVHPAEQPARRAGGAAPSRARRATRPAR